MCREAVRREAIFVDEQYASALAGEKNRSGAAGYACADDYRVEYFR
jgi:hypothetical protein